MYDIVIKEGYNYSFNPNACSTCQGRCCTGESGYIFLNSKEMLEIASFLEMDVKDFAKKFLFAKGSRYSIKERKVADQYECLFFNKEKNGCTIYPVRPSQCRTFPFWNHFKEDTQELRVELQEECPGVIFEEKNE